VPAQLHKTETQDVLHITHKDGRSMVLPKSADWLVRPTQARDCSPRPYVEHARHARHPWLRSSSPRTRTTTTMGLQLSASHI
jgi:hypothetical protein